MPTILRRDGYRFYFYSHEPNEPPHVHVDKGGDTAKVWLADLVFAKTRGFRLKEQAFIVDIVSEHREAMLEAWHEHIDKNR
jgi:hypothetical protein